MSSTYTRVGNNVDCSVVIMPNVELVNECVLEQRIIQ